MGMFRFPERLAKLQATLKRKKLSAFLVTHPTNRRYLSGYTAPDHGIEETAGVLLVPASGIPYLFTDSRYILQAEKEAEGFVVRLYAKGLMTTLQKLLPELSARLSRGVEFFLTVTVALPAVSAVLQSSVMPTMLPARWAVNPFTLAAPQRKKSASDSPPAILGL